MLNTMLTPQRPYLAGVMFHELAHQQLYIDNDSAFNEAFATAVERAGVERWIAAKDDAELAARYQRMQRARQIFLRLALAARKRLIALYDSELAADKKRARKVAILDETRAERATVMAEIGFGGVRQFLRRRVEQCTTRFHRDLLRPGASIWTVVARPGRGPEALLRGRAGVGTTNTRGTRCSACYVDRARQTTT